MVRVRSRRQQVLVLLGLTLLSGHFCLNRNRPPALHQVTFIDVGQGAAALIRMRDGTTVLVDSGGPASDRYNVGRDIVAPFLWKNRISRLDQVVITHPDSDHFNGLPFLISTFRPKRVLINGETGNRQYQDLLRRARAAGIPVGPANPGAVLHQDQTCTLRCLGMAGNDPHLRGNDLSLVLRLECGAISFLLPGDISARAEAILVHGRSDLASTVLLAPHHGSRTSSSPAFLQAVAPQLIVVSAGRHRRAFPAAINRQRWQRHGIPMLNTARLGTITCATNGRTLTVLTGRHQRPWPAPNKTMSNQ